MVSKFHNGFHDSKRQEHIEEQGDVLRRAHIPRTQPAALKSNMILKKSSQCMRFPTMGHVRPAKPQISLRIRAV